MMDIACFLENRRLYPARILYFNEEDMGLRLREIRQQFRIEVE